MRSRCVEKQQDPHAHGHAAGVRLLHVHVMSAQQRDVEPAEPSRGERGKLGVQIVRRGEVGERDLGRVEVVQLDKLPQQLLGGFGDRLRRVRVRRRRAADAPYRHAFNSSLTSDTPSPPRSISSTMALPTTAASAFPFSAFKWSWREMPKPAATGREVRPLTSLSSAGIPSGSSLRAPVIPVTVTQYTKPLEWEQIVLIRSGGVVGATMNTVSSAAERSHQIGRAS